MFTDQNLYIPSHTTAEAKKPEILFQSTPRRYNTMTLYGHRRSWTDSRETYQHAAKKELYLLLENHQQANHEIIIGYLKEFVIRELLEQFALIKNWLHKNGIIAYHVVEITEGVTGYPVNRIHYHFLAVSSFSPHRLKAIFKMACRSAGLEVGQGKDCRVLYAAIPTRDIFEHKCRYILKYATFSVQAILFRPHTGINKVGTIGNYFSNPDGTKRNKGKMWKSIVADWYPDKTTLQQQPLKLSFRFSLSMQLSLETW